MRGPSETAGSTGGPPLRIAFLDSWVRDPARGSGSAVAITGLRRGLEAVGHRVRLIAPRRPRPGLASRLAYNLRLPFLFDPTPFDLVVGFDFDGCFLPRFGDAPPFVASLKGIAADEQRFEAGPARARLRSQAALEAWSVARADAVIVPSRYSARWAGRAYGAPGERTGVVPEGIDLGRWGLAGGADAGGPDPGGADAGGADREPVILSVARQYRRKRTGVLIEAVARLVRQGVPARLRVVGGGPELERLRARAAASGLGPRVRLDGDRPPSEVREAYRDADLFSLPSVQEGFGIAFLEAMAAGLPVVACRAGAAPEVVVDGETGLLVEPDDPRSLARALRGLLRRPELARSMGRRGRRRAARFGWPAVARRFLATCGRLLPDVGSELAGSSAAGRSHAPGLYGDGRTQDVRQLSVRSGDRDTASGARPESGPPSG